VRQKFHFFVFFWGGAVACKGAAAPSALPSYALVYTYRNIMYREETYRLSAHCYAVKLSNWSSCKNKEHHY